MSTVVTLEEAQARLAELVAHLASGDEIIITKDRQPIAKLVRQDPAGRPPRRPGNCKGMITLLVEDDEHLQGFAEYLP